MVHTTAQEIPLCQTRSRGCTAFIKPSYSEFWNTWYGYALCSQIGIHLYCRSKTHSKELTTSSSNHCRVFRKSSLTINIASRCMDTTSCSIQISNREYPIYTCTLIQRCILQKNLHQSRKYFQSYRMTSISIFVFTGTLISLWLNRS